jgi:ribose transport system substrate-binding protein
MTHKARQIQRGDRRRRVASVAILIELVVALGSAGVSSASSPQAQAKAAVAAAAGPVKFISPGGPIQTNSLKGKTIWIVTLVANLPFVQAVYHGAEAAARKAGLKVHLFNSNGSTSNAATGVEEGIAAKAAAIILFAVNADFVKLAVDDASKAHIPVLGLLTVDLHGGIEPGVAAEVTIDYRRSGELLAAYAVATSTSPPQVAYQNFPGIATFPAEKAGVIAGFKKYCPVGCTVASDDLAASQLNSSGVQTLTSGENGRIRGLTWVLSAFDGIAEFAVPAVKTLGNSSIHIGSINAATANLAFVKAGNVQAVDVGNSNGWLGWAAVDRAMRVALGLKGGVSAVPIKLFDQATLASISDLSDEASLFDNVPYANDYAALWKS